MAQARLRPANELLNRFYRTILCLFWACGLGVVLVFGFRRAFVAPYFGKTERMPGTRLGHRGDHVGPGGNASDRGLTQRCCSRPRLSPTGKWLPA